MTLSDPWHGFQDHDIFEVEYQSYYCTIGNYTEHMERYYVWWPWLTCKTRVAQFCQHLAELLVWSATESCPKTSGLRPQHCLGPCRRESSTLWLSTALISWSRRSYCMARTMYTALQWSQHRRLETSFAVFRGSEWRTHWTDVSVNCSWSKVIVVTDVVFTYFLQNDFRCKVLI